MDVRLKCMILKNFKGVKFFKFQPDGMNASIFGENGTGKTTTMDAFLWVLFNKDSTDRTSFKIKPQDEAGNDVHMLQTEVEVALLVDGQILSIRKMTEEKWTTKRGSADKDLTGNTISYWWDEVPVKESEYKQKIGDLVDENIFRIITNPMYFNSRLSWQDRRKILLEISGDMSDEDVLSSDGKLAKLSAILGGKSIEDYKKIIAERLKGLSKEREDIPPRIDELMMSIPNVQPDYLTLESDLLRHQDALAAIEKDMTSAGAIAQGYRLRQQNLYSLEIKLEGIRMQIQQKNESGRKDLARDKGAFENEKDSLEVEVEQFKKTLKRDLDTFTENKVSRDTLLEEYQELIEAKASEMSNVFSEPIDGIQCSSCGQKLPKNMMETQISELREKYEVSKAARINRLEASIATNLQRGTALKECSQNLLSKTKVNDDLIDEKEKLIDQIHGDIEVLETLLKIPAKEPNYESNPEYIKLSNEILSAKEELDKPAEDITADLQLKKREVQEKIDNLSIALNARRTIERTRLRIEELKDEEKRLAVQITEMEGHKYLLEQFVVTKVNLLESKINGRFQNIRFKLFDVQINGGISETCEALVNTNGSYVPFTEANHAGKVNAGIDCINTLSAHFGCCAPIWIDFRESVSRIGSTGSQVINLVKSEADKALRVELEQDLI